MKKENEETNPDSEIDWRFFAGIGLVIGFAIGSLTFFYQDWRMHYGLSFGVFIAGITTVSIIIRIMKRKIFHDHETGFLSGLTSGYFVISYVGSIVNL